MNNKVEFILKNNNKIRLHLKPKTDLDRFKEVLNLKSSIKVVEEKIESIELNFFYIYQMMLFQKPTQISIFMSIVGL